MAVHTLIMLAPLQEHAKHSRPKEYVQLQAPADMCESNSMGAQYVTLEIKIGGRKVKTCQLGLAKWFWPSNFAQFAEADALRLQRKTTRLSPGERNHCKGNCGVALTDLRSTVCL